MAAIIESRSFVRNRGLMSRSKLNLSPSPGDGMSCPPCHLGRGAARPAADQDVPGGSPGTVVALAPRVVCGNVVVISPQVPKARSGAPEVVKRSILKAVIARHEPQALTAQIRGRDRHGDTARAYLS